MEEKNSRIQCEIVCMLCEDVIKTVSYDEFCCRYSCNPFIVCPSCKAAWKIVKKEKSAREEKKVWD